MAKDTDSVDSRPSGEETPGADIDDMTFEQALAELEELVSAIEQGQIGLEESIRQYERGCRLIGHCRSILTESEQRIEQLTEQMKGQFEAEPFGRSRDDKDQQ